MKIKSIFIVLAGLLFLVVSHLTQGTDKPSLASVEASQSKLSLKQVQSQKTGLIFKKDGAFEGYMSLSPFFGQKTALFKVH